MARVRLWLERTREGYGLRDADSEEFVRHSDPRIRVVNAAGVSYRLDALQDDAFAPGKRLALVPEPDNEHDPERAQNSSTFRTASTTRPTDGMYASSICQYGYGTS